MLRGFIKDGEKLNKLKNVLDFRGRPGVYEVQWFDEWLSGGSETDAF